MYLVVHCSATKVTHNTTIEDLDRWHRERGFRKVGYHFFIDRAGELHAGRELTEIGAHVEGYNQESLGICMAGGLDENMNPEDNFTDVQKETLRKLLVALKAYAKNAKVVGHNYLNPHKACPCFDVNKL